MDNPEKVLIPLSLEEAIEREKLLAKNFMNTFKLPQLPFPDSEFRRLAVHIDSWDRLEIIHFLDNICSGLPSMYTRQELQNGARIHISSTGSMLTDVLIELQERCPQAKYWLDTGCGEGFSLISALKLGYNAIGIDNDERTVQKTKINLNYFGFDENRAILGDYLDERIMNTEAGGRKLKDYDIFYSYNTATRIIELLRFFSTLVNPASRIVIPDDSASPMARYSVRQEGLLLEVEPPVLRGCPTFFKRITV